VQNRFFLFLFGFGWFRFLKKLISVRNEFGSVKKTRFGLDIIVIYYSCNYIAATVDDMTLTSLKTMTSK